MKKEISSTSQTPIFEQIKRFDEDGQEFWSARDLARAFEYSEYRHFVPAIQRAKEACENSGHSVADHFVDIHEITRLGDEKISGV